MFDPYEYNGCTITISVDDDAPSPRTDYDNLGTMVCCHSRYNLGDKQYSLSDMHSVPEFGDNAISLPLFLYDHSGLSMNTTGFSCPWDSGQVGYIIVSRERLDEEYDGDYTDEEIYDMLRDEVDLYNQYISGEVYGHIIDFEGVDSPESCWGFYGYDYCKGEAEHEADRILNDESLDSSTIVR
jgi:hypothetical protein